MGNRYWWEREDLCYVDGHLTFGNARLTDVTRSAGSVPCFAYSSRRVLNNIARIKTALAARGLPVNMYFAVKANRFQPLLTKLLGSGEIGIDCCSPAEVLHARQTGFREEQVSFTGTATSEDDLRILARHPNIAVNCDSLTQITRLSTLTPGRNIGLRVNTGVGFSYRSNPRLQYASSEQTSKFGIYEEHFGEAMDAARTGGLRVTGIHCHAGWGLQTSQLDFLAQGLKSVKQFISRMPDVRYVNIGGGLGIPLTEHDEGLNLEEWSSIVDNCLGDVIRDRGLKLYMEPGDYLAKDAGALLLQVTTIERKRDTTFVYVNGGHNLFCGPAQYNLPLIPAMAHAAPEDGKRYTIAGNINEAIDIFGTDISLPGVRVGDTIAMLNAGGYGASMASNHCMRGAFTEYLLD